MWRVSRTGRIGTGVIFGGLGLTAVVDTAAQGSPLIDLWPLLLLLAAVGWLVSWRPAVFFDGEELVVRNPLWTRRIARRDIKSVQPGYSGLVITTEQQRLYTVWAVQKSNLATWTGRSRRADAVASEISAWAHRA